MKTMRFLIMSVALILSMSVFGQNALQTKMKMSKDVMKEKSSKDARKDAKRMEKEGWRVLPGAPSLERQLDRAYMYMNDWDEDGNPMYFMGVGQSEAQNYDAGRMQATALARIEIVHSMESEATSLIESMVGNEQMGKGDATSLTTMIAEGKLFSSQKLGRTIVAVEAYRDLPNKNKEVLVRIVAKSSDIQEIAKNGIRDAMKERGMAMSEKTWEVFKNKNK